MVEADKKKCFVMMPISDTEGYEKGHFNRVYEHLIKPAVLEAGFEPIRADDTSKANFIVVDILQQILDCDMAICDLSSRNPNVFYELGIRQAFNLRTVLIKDNKTAMPFDIAGIRTQPYNEGLRIDDVKKTIPEMIKCIKETSEADAKEVNSLLQLLSIDKPAALPEKVTLSQDSSLIMDAIRDLGNRIDYVTKANVIIEKDKDVIYLPNGIPACIGTQLYKNINNNITPIGRLLGETDKHILLRDEETGLIGISKKSEDGMSLTDVPF